MLTILKLAGGLLSALSGLFAFLRRQQDIETGRQQQREADRKAVDKEVEKANEVERRVDAAGDAERQRMRNKWTRPASEP